MSLPPVSEPVSVPEPRLKRLVFRSHHMGTNENDVLFGAFAERHLGELSAAELDQYEALLAVEDPALFDWVTGRIQPPAQYDTDVLLRLRQFTLVEVKK